MLNKQKNKAERTCMGCNTKKNKCNLIRIVKNKKNEINIDKTGKAEGRGAYICNDINCLKKVMKNKRLEKVFKTKITEDIYNNLKNVIIEN